MNKKNSKSDIEIINNEIEKFQSSADMAARQANQTSRFLSGQLILITGAIITLSSPFLSDRLIDITMQQKYLLSASWIVLAISTGFGIKQILNDYEFFRNWRKNQIGKARKLGSGQYSTGEEVEQAVSEVDENLEIPESNDQNCLEWQIALLSVGFAVFLMTTIWILFSY